MLYNAVLVSAVQQRESAVSIHIPPRSDRVPEDLWTEVHDIVQEAAIKAIPKKKKCKRQNGYLRRPYKQL